MEPVSDNSNIINSILRITFAILFLVLIAELTYFFYIVPNKKITTTIAPTLTPTPAPLIPTKSPTPISLTPSPTKQEFQGKIIKIKVDETETLPGGYKPVLRLSIEKELEENKKMQIFNFAFSKEDIDRITIMDLTGKSISYKDLEIGQNIKISFTPNDIKENNLPNFKITILK
ncbi:MAG: hypothetical protein UR56_C0016G0019 [Candidatus Roizmanbacteria bacterium GW2011_GWC2_34_23]|uniref:Uncharacterized protein n=1 Tax=Candidatus Roizmanbacteria bacterium GW2011_GWC2_34_23 TaxID=1618484 RepID=A0A0G0AVB9_9BACT|nr:MAG: hypothetical protein UR56_C0016G0019 [Candidatus Roizmanbacteria bacterium GW2011_GWC2_34_23]